MSQKKITSSIKIRDILIPIISALAAVGISQLFYFSNLKSQAKIELSKERIKIQTPILNRILSFTYRNEIIGLVQIINQTQPQVVMTITYDEALRTTDTSYGKVAYVNKSDTTVAFYPSFIVDSTKRKKLLNDLDEIIENRDLLDHKIYVEFDKLLGIIERHPFPEVDYETNRIKKGSDWELDKVQKVWLAQINKLKSMCEKKFNFFDD